MILRSVRTYLILPGVPRCDLPLCEPASLCVLRRPQGCALEPSIPAMWPVLMWLPDGLGKKRLKKLKH